MSLLDDALEASKPNRPPCSVARLDEDLRAEVDEVLAVVLDGTSKLTAKGVADALKGRGASISAQTLRRHARGDCSCGTR